MELKKRFRLGLAAGAIAIVAGAGLVLVSNRTNESDPTTVSAETIAAGSVQSVPSVPVTIPAVNPDSVDSPDEPFTTPGMPVEIDVSATKGLRNSSTVTVRGVPQPGSSLFGIEARLCRGDVAITNDIDFRPTMAGLCAVSPLSPGTDARVSEAAAPPYQSVDLTFRVGAGTTTFLTQTNDEAIVTCDDTHPCQLVLKLQYPGAFGFMGIPVTFG